MPLPTGWEPSVIITLVFILSSFATLSNCFLRCFASFMESIFASLPTGISMMTCDADTEPFFAIIEARSWPSASMLKGCSTFMIVSSAGARSTAPPQTMQPPVFFTTFFIWLIERETFVRTSIVSAVPAGDVIDLELVLGTVRPAATRIGTMTIVVLFPATPPMQCLSIMCLFLILSVSPLFIIALVRATISFMLIPRM